MALTNPHGKQMVLVEEHVTPKSTTFHVQQKRGLWTQNFSIAREDGSLLFVVKHSIFEDEVGHTLFHLKRTVLSQKKAWVLEQGRKDALSVNYRWWHSHMTMDITLHLANSDEPQMVLEARGKDVLDRNVSITASGSKVAEMRRKHQAVLSKLMLTAPTWEVKVAEGMDMSLVHSRPFLHNSLELIADRARRLLCLLSAYLRHSQRIGILMF